MFDKAQNNIDEIKNSFNVRLQHKIIETSTKYVESEQKNEQKSEDK